MKLPQNIVDWPAEWKELLLERAAIMEHEGKMSRYAAERLAEQDTRRHAEKAP
jgi:hypothetical protein